MNYILSTLNLIITSQHNVGYNNILSFVPTRSQLHPKAGQLDKLTSCLELLYQKEVLLNPHQEHDKRFIVGRKNDHYL